MGQRLNRRLSKFIKTVILEEKRENSYIHIAHKRKQIPSIFSALVATCVFYDDEF